MPSFSKASHDKLYTCHTNIICVFERVVQTFDCTVIEGHRAQERQLALLAAGKSQTAHSKHLSNPSMAIDVAPFPVDWDDRERFILFGGYVLGVASELEIRLRWGGDWNDNLQVKDNKFDDLVHFELI